MARAGAAVRDGAGQLALGVLMVLIPHRQQAGLAAVAMLLAIVVCARQPGPGQQGGGHAHMHVCSPAAPALPASASPMHAAGAPPRRGAPYWQYAQPLAQQSHLPVHQLAPNPARLRGGGAGAWGHVSTRGSGPCPAWLAAMLPGCATACLRQQAIPCTPSCLTNNHSGTGRVHTCCPRPSSTNSFSPAC